MRREKAHGLLDMMFNEVRLSVGHVLPTGNLALAARHQHGFEIGAKIRDV